MSPDGAPLVTEIQLTVTLLVALQDVESAPHDRFACRKPCTSLRMASRPHRNSHIAIQTCIYIYTCIHIYIYIHTDRQYCFMMFYEC